MQAIASTEADTPTGAGRRVLVAMSGGVDSAVAAALLHAQGYEVVGVTLRLYTEPDETVLRSRRTCCGVEDVADARAAAQRIGIPHYVLNMEREFQRDVVDYFVGAYVSGRTPNPCLACNQYVKFSTLLERALAMGFDLLATGHYARVEACEVGGEHRYRLLAAADDEKDQSYVLYTLGQDALARTLFPLGDLPKTETRRIASALELPVAGKPDSADICFVPGGDYRQLLRSRGVENRPGTIVGTDGAVLGRHEGVEAYTVGQRRGLGLSGPARRFVTAIDAGTSLVTVGTEDELYRRSIHASSPQWVDLPPAVGEPLQARVRYHAEPAPATVRAIGAEGFEVEFDPPVRGAAPGQALVLYRRSVGGRPDEVVGGGTIEPPARQQA